MTGSNDTATVSRVDDLHYAVHDVVWYDRDGCAWNDTTAANSLWSCPNRGLVKQRGHGYLTEYGPFTREKETMSTKLLDVSKAQDRIAELEALLEAERQGLLAYTPDEPAEGSVIKFRKYTRMYSYAALNVNGLWFVTQDGSRSARQGVPPMEWDDLVDWIGPHNWDTIEVLS